MTKFNAFFFVSFFVWIVGVAAIVFGSEKTFLVSWVMQIVGIWAIGWIFLMLISRKILNIYKLNKQNFRIAVFAVIFCFYLIFPAGTMLEIILYNFGWQECFHNLKGLEKPALSRFFKMIAIDALNISVSIFVSTFLILLISKLTSKYGNIAET